MTIAVAPPSTLTAVIAAHVARAGAVPLSPARSTATRALLLHNLTVGLAAHGMPLPGIAGDRALPWAERPTTAPDLAFATALRMGARAQHDEHPRSVTHLGSAVTPACLAIARRSTDGARLLTAIAVGYQVGGVLGEALLPAVRARGMRATGVVGPIAAAAAVAVVLELDAERTANAVALAASRAAGTTEVWLAGTDEWRLQTAAAARDGLESALWATAGVRGAPTALEGRSGLLHALGADPIGASSLAEALDGAAVVEQVLRKAHPVCAINQAAVEVAIALRERLGAPAPGDIEHVRVQLSDADAAYPGIDLAHPPASWAQAMMDARQGVAVALADGRVDVDALHPGDEPVQRLRERVDVIAGLPAGDGHGAAVTVTLRDGRSGRASAEGVEIGVDRARRMALELLPAAGISRGIAQQLPSLVAAIDAPGGLARLGDTLFGIEPWGSLCAAR